MNVLLVTSDRDACGIREYGRMLMAAVHKSDPSINFVEWPYIGEIPPNVWDGRYQVLHLNHHAALHSAWTAHTVDMLQKDLPVLVTQHDTYETWEIMQARGFTDFRNAAALVVHEQVLGLTDQLKNGGRGGLLPGVESMAYHIQQPVPEIPLHACANRIATGPGYSYAVGTIGFDFDWKNFDLLVEAAREAGWSVMIISPGITAERARKLREMIPGKVLIYEQFMPWRDALTVLHQFCDATAFLHVGGFSGTSGSIRMGLGARRPVIAFEACRQFKDLENHPGILWAGGKNHVVEYLGWLAKSATAREILSKKVAELAERISWTHAGQQYAQLYKQVLGRRRQQ